MNFRETARRMISDWYKNKKRAGTDSPKNVVQKNSQVMEACDRVMGYNTNPPKEQKLAAEKYGKRMEAVIESIVTNSSMGDHFAYFDASPLCGSCGLVMCTEGAEYVWGKNFKLRVRCLNYRCHHNGILYEVVPEKSAVIVMRRVDEKKTE